MIRRNTSERNLWLAYPVYSPGSRQAPSSWLPAARLPHRPSRKGSANPAATAVAQALASNTWTRRAPYPGPEALGLSAGVVPNAAGQPIVYTLGGHAREGNNGSSIQTYNVATDQWGVVGDGAFVRVSDANGVGRIGKRLYLTGGRTYREGFEAFRATLVYQTNTNRLFNVADMPLATADGVTGVIDGKLYVLPGTCSTEPIAPPPCVEGVWIRQLYRYDPATNVWITRRPAPRFHASGAGGVIGGKFYVVGGSGPTGTIAGLDVYDPATNSWKSLAPMPVVGDGDLVAAVVGSKLYVVSWRLVNGIVKIRNYAYNPNTNTWTVRAAPPVTGELVRVNLDGRGHLLLVNSSDINRSTYLYTP